jgi:hypothetical protein
MFSCAQTTAAPWACVDLDKTTAACMLACRDDFTLCSANEVCTEGTLHDFQGSSYEEWYCFPKCRTDNDCRYAVDLDQRKYPCTCDTGTGECWSGLSFCTYLGFDP